MFFFAIIFAAQIPLLCKTSNPIVDRIQGLLTLEARTCADHKHTWAMCGTGLLWYHEQGTASLPPRF